MGKLASWVEDRYNLRPLIDFLKKKQVPMGRGWYWSYMGGVALFLCAIQLASGILLLMYYKASAGEAYESIRFITSKVQFGWLIRNIHSWSANLLLLVAFLHMFSVFFQRAYRRPRELTWVTGIILGLLGMFFGFSGYLLPWNELSFFATKVGTEIVGAIPLVGKAIMTVLRGGEDVTGATLPRFFGIHVAILPAVFVVFLTIHLVFIQLQGMHEPRSWVQTPPEKRRSMPFFPHFMLRDVLLWLIVLNIVAVFAVFFPWELGSKADLFAPAPANIRPEWYFVFMFQTLKFIPPHVLGIEGEVIGILGFMAGILVWLIVPFIDLKDDEKRYRMLIRIGIGVIVVVYIAAMTVWGYMV
ncbi:MAG: cytochrome bc complex cytochrome b subunit [Candidatus Brocadiales bacterium]|nr:cytochrome bc complex cytochrome b subunit [Candidatus Bathyanammoxibius sp.]